MRKSLVVLAVLVVTAGLAVGGWLIWEGRARERALVERLESVESKHAEFTKSVDLLERGVINALQRVKGLEDASANGAYERRYDPTADDLDGVADEVQALQDEVRSLCMRQNDIDPSIIRPC